MPTISQCVGPPIPAGATAQFTSRIYDEFRNPVPGTALTSLQLTIADTLTGQIINSVNGVNILNVGRGTVDQQGNVTVNLQTGDTALQYPAFPIVKRSLILVGVYNAGFSTVIHQADFLIEGLLGAGGFAPYVPPPPSGGNAIQLAELGGQSSYVLGSGSYVGQTVRVVDNLFRGPGQTITGNLNTGTNSVAISQPGQAIDFTWDGNMWVVPTFVGGLSGG